MSWWPLIVATTLLGSRCATASGPLGFNCVVEAGAAGVWPAEEDDDVDGVLAGGVFGPVEVCCAHTTTLQRKTTVEDRLRFIREANFSSTLACESALPARPRSYCTYAFFKLDAALALPAPVTCMLLITCSAPELLAIRVADPLC